MNKRAEKIYNYIKSSNSFASWFIFKEDADKFIKTYPKYIGLGFF